jgi:hypothetical protein
MRRLGAGVAVLAVAVTLVTPPAQAQNSSAWLTPRSPEPLEASGKVVLTVTMWRAGRVAYRTFDGACDVGFDPAGSPPNAICSGNEARAPQDYPATSGELVFTAGGSKTITIPIVDDHVAEGSESFTLAAWEDVNADPWLPRGDSVIVRIVNDDEYGSSSADTSATTVAGGRRSSSNSGATVPPRTAPIDEPPAVDLEKELASPTLQPGPGFELSSEEAPRPAPARGGAGGGSGSPWLAAGLAVAAGGVIAAAVMRRRKQWSPTRS